MKKIFTVLFVIISVSLFCQAYHFNYYISYKNDYTRDRETSTAEFNQFVNTEDKSYSGRIVKGEKTKFGLQIIDYNNNISHYFDLKNNDFPIENKDFVYLRSVKIKETKTQFENELKRRFFRSELINDDGNMLNYRIQESKREGSKRSRATADVTFQRYKDDLSSVGLATLFDFQEISKKLSFHEKMIVSEGSIKFDQATVKIKLSSVENCEITLTVK